MKIRLHTRFSLLIVALVLVLVGVLSSGLFYQIQVSTSEIRGASKEAVGEALFNQVENQGRALAQTLADSLTNHLYYYQMDVIEDLAQSARKQHGVEYVYIHDPSGVIIHDGTKTLESYGLNLSDEQFRQVSKTKKVVTWFTGRAEAESGKQLATEGTFDLQLFHVAAPIMLGSEFIGGVRIGFSLKGIIADIAAAQARLSKISDSGMEKLLLTAAVATLILIVLGTFLGILLARRLSRPIETLAGVAEEIGKGQYEVDIPIRRSDEIGDLAVSIRNMAQEREKAERQNALLATFLENIGDAVEVTDADLRVQYVNPAHERVTGYPASDAVGNTPAELHRPTGHDPEIYDAMMKAVSSGKVWSGEVLAKTKDGRLCYQALTVSPVSDDTGAITNYIGIRRDITKQRRVEHIQRGRNNVLELLAKGQPLEEILTVLVEHSEQTSQGMIGSVLLMDDDAKRLLSGAAPGLPDFYNDAIHGVEIGDGIGSCGTAAYTHETVIVDDISTHPFWADYKELALKAGLKACWSQPIFSSRREVLGTFAMYYKEIREPTQDELDFIRDVANLSGIAIERRRTEEALGVALVDAENANQAKSEFLATMSHELRTPLNAISGFSEMLTGEFFGALGSPKYREYAGDIYDSSGHLLDLVNDILDLSAIEAGKHYLAKESLNVNDVIEDCSPLISATADRKGITYSVEVPEGMRPLHADRRALKQIFLNVLSNAVKFTPKGGRITLKATASNGHHVFEVSDTGEGVPKDKLPSLTDPFVKAENNPHRAQEGSGLGLAIVKSLVGLHDGELDIKSKVGVGTTVTVTFPNAAP